MIRALRSLGEGRYKSGSCIVCGQGTDTDVTFEGEAEWNIALLTWLGLSDVDAIGVVSYSHGLEPPNVPTGRRYLGVVRVCGECYSASGLPSYGLHLAIPGVRRRVCMQPHGDGTDR